MENLNLLKCKAGIKDGKIFFIEMEDGVVLPTITPDPHVILRINDQEVEDQAQLNPEDQIEILPRTDVISPALLKIKVSQDNLSACISLTPSQIKTFELVDQEPTEELRLNTREFTQKELSITKEELFSQLEIHKVTWGIIQENVDRFLECPSEEPVEIARGTPPQPSRDAELILLFKQEFQTAPGINSSGNVDYRETLQIPYVRPGTVLAKKIPADFGEPGITVSGEKIQIPKAKDFSLQAGANTRLNSTGEKIKSTIYGFPQMEQKGLIHTFSVTNEFLHSGDVDLSSGNIRFQGDITVQGSITEGMSVLAGGKLMVQGSVNNAALQSAGHLTIQKSVINSALLAGGIEALLLQLQPVINDLEYHLNNLLMMVQLLKDHPRFKGKQIQGKALTQMVRMLAGTKIPDLANIIKDFDERVKKISGHTMSFKLPLEFLQNLSKLAEDFTYFFSQSTDSFIDCDILLKRLRFLKEDLKKNPVPPSDISVGYCLNSLLEASQNVWIHGQGSFQSDIKAMGEIKVTGILRGGTLHAGGDVFVKEVGSSSGVITHIKVPSKNKITINKAYENTCISIGKQTYRFTMPRTNIDAYQEKGSIFLN